MAGEGRDLTQLRLQVQRLVRGARAATTNRQYASHLRKFNVFISERGLQVSQASLELYLAQLHVTKQSYAVVGVVSAVRAHLRQRGEYDFTGEPRVRDMMKAIQREAAQGREDLAVRDPLPVWVVRRYVLCPLIPGEDAVLKARDLALVGLGLRLMRRPSELARIRVRHLSWDREGWLWVVIAETKTNKTGKAKKVPIEPVSGSVSCPVRLVRAYLSLVVRSADDFLFLGVNGRAMSTSAISSVVQRMAQRVGAEGRFTGYSLRIGGATAAVRGGMTTAQIRSVGDWESKAILFYMRAVGAAGAGMSARMGF